MTEDEALDVDPLDDSSMFAELDWDDDE